MVGMRNAKMLSFVIWSNYSYLLPKVTGGRGLKGPMGVLVTRLALALPSDGCVGDTSPFGEFLF